MSALDDFASAIEQNESSCITSLLLHREVDANARLPRDNNPPALVLAALCGRDVIVEQLLNADARIDDVDDEGHSACHAAAVRGHANVVRLLLRHRPNLALKNSDGETALQNAIRIDPRRNEDVALLLIRAGAPLDDVDRRNLCGLAAISTTAVQVLMDHNVAISDLRDDFGQTPLHIATGYAPSDAALLSKLVDCGVDLDAISGEPHYATCSAYAIVADSVDALRLFVLRGANVDGAGWHGGVLLHDLIHLYSYECVILLLAAGADVTARDREGRTPCLLAATQMRPRLQSLMPFVHAMLAAGADLDAADPNGETPRQFLTRRQIIVDPSQVEAARREIAKTRLDFVRDRAIEVCVGLQPLQLDALQMCVILQHACGPVARLIAFHQWWKIATTVKHFKSRAQ